MRGSGIALFGFTLVLGAVSLVPQATRTAAQIITQEEQARLATAKFIREGIRDNLALMDKYRAEGKCKEWSYTAGATRSFFLSGDSDLPNNINELLLPSEIASFRRAFEQRVRLGCGGKSWQEMVGEPYPYQESETGGKSPEKPPKKDPVDTTGGEPGAKPVVTGPLEKTPRRTKRFFRDIVYRDDYEHPAPDSDAIRHRADEYLHGLADARMAKDQFAISTLESRLLRLYQWVRGNRIFLSGNTGVIEGIKIEDAVADEEYLFDRLPGKLKDEALRSGLTPPPSRVVPAENDKSGEKREETDKQQSYRAEQGDVTAEFASISPQPGYGLSGTWTISVFCNGERYQATVLVDESREGITASMVSGTPCIPAGGRKFHGSSRDQITCVAEESSKIGTREFTDRLFDYPDEGNFRVCRRVFRPVTDEI